MIFVPVNSRFSLRDINRLAIPAILSGIAEPIISLCDNAFIGKLGTEELAASGIATSFFLLVVWVLAQTRTATSALVAQALGSQRLRSVKHLVPQAFWVSVFFGVLFLVGTNLISTTIFELYGAKGEVLELCVVYFGIRSFGFPLTLGAFSLFGVFRGLQNTTWAMYISLTGAAINIVLDYALIYGVDGVVPAMGIEGAALASVIAQFSILVGAVIFTIIKTPFRFLPPLRPHPLLGRFAGMSSDLMVRTIALNFVFYLATRLATELGDASVAAHTIAINIWLFSAFFIDGYAHAGNALAGKWLGAGDAHSLSKTARAVSLISIGIALLLCAVYGLGYFHWAHFFTEDPAVIAAFEGIFWVVIASQPINAVAFALDGIFKGLGETKFLRNLLIGSSILIFVPLAGLLYYLDIGLISVWLAFAGWMVARSLIPWLRFQRVYSP